MFEKNFILGKKSSILKCNIRSIKKNFLNKGLLIFRNFKCNEKEIKAFIDKFTITYANDASRRLNTKNFKEIRGVDGGLDSMKLHSEASFSPSWPEILWFYCDNPPKTLGQTTLCDGQLLWQSFNYKTKNFFLKNLIKYEMEIPVPINSKNFKKRYKNWVLNEPGAYDTILDYEKNIIKIKQLRFAVTKNFNDKLSFCNHLISSALKLDPTVKKISLMSNRKLPLLIKNEILKNAKKLTVKHDWKKFR